tara:strand:- start:139 stop:258 length:120 start_codon:yes stop_codon:yes gene_type:complete
MLSPFVKRQQTRGKNNGKKPCLLSGLGFDRNQFNGFPFY